MLELIDGFQWKYICEVVRVIDGDTVELDVDLGFSIRYRLTVRLYGIDAPEQREKPQGPAATAFLRKLIEGKQIVLESIKDKQGKYGRYLGKLWLQDAGGDVDDVNQMLVDMGYAELVP
ncbi:Thermonuclease precursor [Polystyrenella longa]|uniref:Thermonuclease n=1 Tax=Polystyrenella longa TaxID=2528007 RepID=A0A518CTZ8_9PLAN|nr:thermonuclease family protein [Polystyrenella longa]QDU82695.1 Thermonuclease precursor [Polystyrenella longa]